MDPIDSGQEQEKPLEQCWDLTPSSKGRQRKKNSKYLDYETDDPLGSKSLPQKQPKKSSEEGGETSPKKSSVRSPKAKNATQHIADGEEEATDKTPQDSDGKISEETPKKRVRARKTYSKRTAAKKTPAKKTPTTHEGPPAAAGVAADTGQQENGTPKPKRKYVRKQPVPTPVIEPPCGENQNPVAPEEEAEPGGRRRRGAARAALKYLRNLAKEMLSHNREESGSQPSKDTDTNPVTVRKTPKGSKVPKGRKRKRPDYDSDAAEDEDFVPDVEEDEEEEEGFEETEDEGEEEDSDLDLRTCGRGPAIFRIYRNSKGSNAKSILNAMKVVWDATETTKKFREEHYSSWVFPEWVPSTSDWHLVPESGLEEYLPQQLHSAAFKVSREGLSKEETPLHRLSRFGAVSPHPDRWDMLLYAGGPIWAMEWCPTPDGASATQYIALACHQGMDDIHYVNKMYTGSGLVQLWDVGNLEYNTRPDSQPCLAYGFAQDKGFIWQLKWCPAGGWELPSCERKAPFLPRLGLLAVATSTSVVTIYSLPHPDALHSNKKLCDSDPLPCLFSNPPTADYLDQVCSVNQKLEDAILDEENTSQQLPIYKAKEVIMLKLGAFKSPRHEKSGQVLSMDWLPEKPHNIMAIGFYDGVVGLWDLCTKSSLLRVRESNESLSLLPYRCILAHDHAVRALAFCPASRNLLVTAGEDRFVKTWDLRTAYCPLTVQKRYLINEICWPLNAPGLLMGQESAYAPKGSQGVHYMDHYLRSLFAIPRTSTVWSISYTDWMNCVVTADTFGEMILAMLPQINYISPYLRRTLERRFPVYFTSLVPFDSTEEDNQETGETEVEGDAVEVQDVGDKQEPDAQSDGENKKKPEKGSEEESERKDESPTLQFETYKEAAKKYVLHYTDYDIRTFAGSEKRALWKRMKDTELNAKMNLDKMPLAALHKVRFNPNMNCHTWLVSGGQTGLVRLNCLRGMISPNVKKIISGNQSQFIALSSPQDQVDQTVTDEL